MCSGTSASLVVRDSHQTKIAKARRPPTIKAQISASQPRCSPSWSPKTSANIATPLSTTPIQSKVCSWVASTGTSRQLRTNATMPTGTLMRKIHSQPPTSTSTPPRIGPTRVATPAVAPHSAIAWPRRSAGKIRVMTAIVCGVIIAAPTPWTTRAAISISIVPLSAAPERGGREDRQAGEVDPLRPEAVAQAPMISTGTAYASR